MCRLKWWLFFFISLLAVGGAFFFGLMQALWKVDGTKIGPMIILVYFAFSGFVGWLTTQAEQGYPEHGQTHLRSCYLAVKSCVVLGIIGTAAGLLIMLNAAFAGSSIDPAAVLAGMRSGLSTLGITTLVGLLCYLGLEIQVVNLEYALEAETPPWHPKR